MVYLILIIIIILILIYIYKKRNYEHYYDLKNCIQYGECILEGETYNLNKNKKNKYNFLSSSHNKKIIGLKKKNVSTIRTYNENNCDKYDKNEFTINEIAKAWKKGGGELEDCPYALITSSDSFNKDKNKYVINNIGIGGIWKQGFYNISPKKYGYCFNKSRNGENPCCNVKEIKRTLKKPKKDLGYSYTCFNAPKKIPKGIVGEGNENYIGKFCHIGGENYYKEKQMDIKYDSIYQFSGGSCYKNCTSNKNCQSCKDKYEFPYYYYNKYLENKGYKNINKKNMKDKEIK